ncbi:MAG TPA: cation:proton antiporter [Microthrixaceae bacterium]|nr:cation:proton antiporter [Microthrixaceae bacterium]
MDIAHILRDILVVLVAAKLAAEVAERLGIPAVVGEILAGILIGPSVIDLVSGQDEVLRTLGEIGVILLLLEVGMEMDLFELGKVGRSSMSVATIGVVTPLVLGMAVMGARGEDFNTSLFIGAALTATSVGITARVFGDLKALATTEARIVLGAAVADDVMGLIVLTIVVRLVTEGTVSVLSVLGIILGALAFLVVGGLVGIKVAPLLFNGVEKISRSTGTMVALALAFTLAFAELANLAKLAPIVGAFVAGIALGRTRQHERIQRELAPVGHLFIPVFFLQIGIDVDVTQFGEPKVLGIAALLLAVAVVGKLVAAFGVLGTRADKWLIGFGMLPRGEVGLIFATIGLTEGVLGQDLYAALLIVVLVTTLTSPQLLKFRFSQLRSMVTRPTSGLPVTFEPPRGGWLRVIDGQVRLAATPPPDRVLTVALEAAVELADARPSEELLDYLGASVAGAKWDDRASASLRKVVERGNPRSWRFLEAVGVLDAALPEVAETLRARSADPWILDTSHTHRWATLERLRSLRPNDPLRAQYERLAHPEWLLLGALLLDGLEGRSNPGEDAASIVRRVGYGGGAEREIVGLVEDDGLLRSAAERVEAFDEEEVLQLASHLDTPERARATYLLAALRDDSLEVWEIERVGALHELLQRALADAELTGLDTRNLVERHRTDAMLLAKDHPDAVERIRHAPRAYIARQQPDAIVRHAELTVPPVAAGRVRVKVHPADDGRWWVDVASRNRPGLMAAVTGALAEAELDVDRAVVATWDDDAAIESFLVDAAAEPKGEELATDIERELESPLEVGAVDGAEVVFDDLSSPWHTVCEITAPDNPGLLHTLTTVFAAASIEIKAANIGGTDSLAVDRFEVMGRDGPRLNDQEREMVRSFLATGLTAKPRRFRRGFAVSVAKDAALPD